MATVSAPAAGAAGHRLQRLGKRAGDLLRTAPVTFTFVAVLWALALATSSLAAGPEPPLLQWVSVTPQSLPQHWPAVLLSGLWAGSAAGYVAGTLLALAIGLPAERLLGSRRLLAAGALTHLAGVLAGIGFALLAGAVFPDWGRELALESFVGPTALLCGVAAAGSAGTGTLWRRRLRLFLFTLLVLLVLYSGSFQTIVVLAAAVSGAAVGPLLFGRRPHPAARLVSSRREARVLVAIAVAATAAGPVLAALSVEAAGPLAVLRYLYTDIQALNPQALEQLCADPGRQTECNAARFELRAGPAGFFLVVLPQILLLVLCDGLRRGRRFAWTAALVLQAAMTATAAVRLAGYLGAPVPDQDPYGIGSANPLAAVLPMLVPLAVLLLLALTGRLFTVSAPPGTYRRFSLAVAASALILAALYLGGGLLFRTGFTPEATPARLLADLPACFIPLVELSSANVLLPLTLPAAILYEGVGLLFWLIVCVLLLLTFLRPPGGETEQDRQRARTLLKTHGGSTLAWMTLWPGNRYWFSGGGRSYVAYRLDFGVALTVGEPVGPADELAGTVRQFAAWCMENGLQPCFYSVGERVRAIAAADGCFSLEVAEETVLDLEHLEFRGRKFQDARTALNKARKLGIHAEWTTYRQAPPAVLDQLRAISEEWVADKGMPEMGFTLGGLEEVDDPEVRVLLAVDGNRTVHGVTSWLPVYRDGQVRGWTLDFMRRRDSGFPGTMDFLIASAALSLKDEGVGFLSLSGAPLARAEAPPGQQTGSPAVLDRVLDRLGSTLEPVYGFRSLLAFKAKFQPRYEPLYMSYPDPAALPAIANALARAYLPHVSVGQGLTLARRIIGSSR